MEGAELSHPSDDDLIKTYIQIEESARDAFQSGQVVGNPFLAGEAVDTRYSICAQGLINGSKASVFLQNSIDLLKAVEPTIEFVDPHSLHLTFQEVCYTPKGIRDYVKEAGSPLKNVIDSLRLYHKAISNKLPSYDPIRLRLLRVFPTLDAPIPNSDSRSASIVASFLTDSDPSIYRIRRDIGTAVTNSGLPFNSRLGAIKVIFFTLGRLRQSPTIEEEGLPILRAIDKVNEEIPSNCFASIENIDLISTTSVSYPYPYGHLYAWPPIALDINGRIDGLNKEFKVLRPSQRRAI